MSKRFLSALISLIIVSYGFSQKPVAVTALALFNGRHPESFDLFNPATESKGQHSQYVDNVRTMTIKPEVISDLKAKDPGIFTLTLPSPFNISLDLYRVNIYSSTARIKTSDGKSFAPNPSHKFYRGIIHDNPNSLAVVTVLNDRIQILYSDESGNKRIQHDKGGTYIAFADKDILIPNQIDCHTSDNEEDHRGHAPDAQRSMSGNCVEVYVECDHKSYVDNGSSVSNTEEWVAELWNEVITLYDNEDIPVMVSDIFVYTSTDPFAALSSTSSILSSFAAHIDTLTYNGRLAHLLSTRSLGGGIAYLDVLCSNSNPCAFSSSLSTNIVPFPTYSWTVEVVTHEMGHNMGSPHTHACAWNGNNTAIDGCGPTAGYSEGCTAPLPTSGTIMSYCHLVSGVGINFNNGFGTQPGNLIRNEYNSASCNTGGCTPPLCTSLTNPAPNAINVDVYNDLTWASAAGANGYRLTIGTTPDGFDILNNVDVGLVTTYNPVNAFPFITTIYVKIVPYNELGDAPCTYQSFTTEPNVPALCTQVTSPQAGSTNVSLTAIIQWPHAFGNQTGYKITIGTTPNGGEIANMLDVGNVTSYDPPGFLPYSSTIYVKITPYGPSGDVSGCNMQSFTTATPVNGDFCEMAISLPCGGSISGNTSQAYADPNAIFCETSVDAPGIWFTFVGNGQNTILSTCAQYGYDIKLNAYTGTCNSLTCVTGNDDYCNTGSLISFPTINGTTYYVLVQGWNGSVGSFTIGRSCYSGPFYCPSQSINSSIEWIKTLSLNGYTKQSGSSTYSDFTGEIIDLSRGGSHAVTITPQFAQGSRSEYYRVWIDLNKDGDFTDASEQVFAAGPTQSAATGNITVPLTASTGITRMRVSMRYNSAPSSCNAFGFGEVEDYSVNIRCNLVTVTTDSGNGSLRSVSACADDNEPILFAPSLNNQTINITAGPLMADGIWKWMPGANTNITIQAQGITRVLSVPSGKTVEMQNLLLIGGTATSGSVIDNSGTLILRNTDLKRAAGSTSTVLQNKGGLTIQESCDIKQ